MPAPRPRPARAPAAPAAPGGIVGRSRAIARVLEQVRKVASTPRTTVLVTGESGVGKELVARAIHERSSRACAPFVPVNCAALAGQLLEAELFGYEPGAFTGADAKGREGLFAAAEGGTLFLDEIGELAPELQAKLLRVLQERSYRRVGATEDRLTDVRIVASTNRDLAAMVEAGRFREDLFYRLNVLCIVVPPLRERAEDVAILARHFTAQVADELGLSDAQLAPEALETLQGLPWRGNVRELRNVVERALVLAGGEPVTPAHLPGGEGAPPDPEGASGPVLELPDFSIRSMEEALIRRALQETRGNRSRTARLLGVNRATLYNKLRAYSIA